MKIFPLLLVSILLSMNVHAATIKETILKQMDQNARLNIKNIYLPELRWINSYSAATEMTTENKFRVFTTFIKNAEHSLNSQWSITNSPLSAYTWLKLKHLQATVIEARANGDFKSAFQMTSNAEKIISQAYQKQN